MCIINCYLTLPYLHYYMFDKILQTRELEMKTYIPYNLNNMNKIHPQVNIFMVTVTYARRISWFSQYMVPVGTGPS